MRIGLSTSVIGRGQTGIAQYVFALMRAFARHASQHQFALFVLEDDLPLFSFVQPAMTLVPVSERFRPPINNILWHQIVLPRLARRQQLDLLHVPSYRRMLWARPCPLVATIHDLAPFRVANKYDWKRMFYGRVVARQLARRQDRIIAVSRNTARDVSRHFRVPAERLTVIHNGVEHDRFCPGSHGEARAFVAQRFGVRQPFFLYLARLEHPGKNHLRLLEAFNQFRAETNSVWDLALAGSDWQGAHIIHEAIRRSPFAQNIHFLGFVPEADLPQLYRAAAVFVYPSLYEGFGLPPVEAMACGCPVLCSTRGSLGEVVGNAAATANPEDVSAMKWQLARLAADAALREQLRAAGLTQARRFDWRQTAASTLEVYTRASARAESRHLRSAKSIAPMLRQVSAEVPARRTW
jgi:glycosyltransferase involved in cell wall biosynthesis